MVNPWNSLEVIHIPIRLHYNSMAKLRNRLKIIFPVIPEDQSKNLRFKLERRFFFEIFS